MHAENTIYDAAIVGGGPAGVSCAVWLARLGLAPILVERGPAIGGLCLSHPFPDNWNATLPGFTGPQVAENLALSLEQAGVPTLTSSATEHAAPHAAGYTLQVAGRPAPIIARHLVLATGVRARTLPQPDARGVEGILVGPGSHIVSQDFQGRRVAVLGGGDNAFENALYAMGHGAQVDLYARTVRAQHQFVRQFPAEAITIGSYQVSPAALHVNGKAYDLVMVFYGWEPCMQFAHALNLRRSARGFVATDMETAQTSVPGVYAIGEVAQRLHPCVVTALADGVTAAKAIQARTEAAS